MIYGETRAIILTESSSVPFNLSSGQVSIQILQPDGTYITSPIVPVVTGNNDNTSYTISNLFTPEQAGTYRVNWLIGEGSESIKRIATYFASYTDIRSYLRDTLRISIQLLPDARIDKLFASLSTRLFRIYAPGYNYSDLTLPDDQTQLDEGICLILAAQLRSQLPKSVPLGELQTITHSDTTFSYSNPYAGRKGTTALPTLEEDWTRQAWERLSMVSIFSGVYDEIMSTSNSISGVRDDRRVTDDEFANFVNILNNGGYIP